MADLGTLSLGDVTPLVSTAIVGTNPVLELIASAVDSSYVHDNTNTTHTGTASAPLENVPADFGNMDTLFIQARFLQSGLSNNTWDFLRAQVFQSDGTTPLTDITTISSTITETSPTNSGAIQCTGVDTTSNKDVWDGAIVQFTWNVTKNKGGDSHSLRVTAAEVTGTYTAGAASEDATANPTGVAGTGASGTLTATGTAAVSISGVAGTSAAGSVTASGSATTALTGASATGAAGTVTASGEAVENATANLSGVSASGFAGTATVTAEASVAVDGVQATGAAGTVDVQGGVLVSLDGVEATGAAGTVTASSGGSSSVTLDGAAATGSAGAATASGDAVVVLSGVVATGFAGSSAAEGDLDVTVNLTGVQASGAVGSITAIGDSPAYVTTATSGSGQVKRRRKVRSFIGVPDQPIVVRQDASVVLRGARARGEAGFHRVVIDESRRRRGIAAVLLH